MALPPFRLEQLYELLCGRKTQRKEGSYTSYLFEKGPEKILKKIGEECTEVVTVSYTHLDVYKRQDKSPGAFIGIRLKVKLIFPGDRHPEICLLYTSMTNDIKALIDYYEREKGLSR